MSNYQRLHDACVDAGYTVEKHGDDGLFHDWDVHLIIEDLHQRVEAAEKKLELIDKCKKCRVQTNRLR